MRRAAGVLVAVAVLLAAAPGPAHAQAQPETQTVRGTLIDGGVRLTEPPTYDAPPPGQRRSAREVLRAADAVPKVRAEKAAHPHTYERAYLREGGGWQVAVYDATTPARTELAQVVVSDRTGAVTEAWTGWQVAWPMARGYPGAFGRAVNAPWIWIGLCILFVLPFARPPLRLLHLDLAVLLAFGVSYAFFGAADLGVSVPSAYPLLAYLLVRMLMVARRPPGALPARLLTSDAFLALGIVFLTGFRIALNVTNGNVIDVGYAGVIGADRITGPGELYGSFPPDNEHGDTYGPIAYLAYVPFRLIFGWSGSWDDLPAAHAAALAFDLGSAALLFLIGRRVKDASLGLLFAYLWMAFPFTLLVANSGANDSLVALLVLAAVLALHRPAARGAAIALAGLTKFAPLALAPLFVRSRRPAAAAAAAGVAAVAALTLAPLALAGELRTAYDRTLGFQASRVSPFSIWGYYGLPHGLQIAAQVAAAALALGVVVWPRGPRSTAQVAALAAAVLIALQLTVEHWFYLYLVWFAPLVWIALLSPRDAGPARSTPPPAAAAASSESAPR